MEEKRRKNSCPGGRQTNFEELAKNSDNCGEKKYKKYSSMKTFESFNLLDKNEYFILKEDEGKKKKKKKKKKKDKKDKKNRHNSFVEIRKSYYKISENNNESEKKNKKNHQSIKKLEKPKFSFINDIFQKKDSFEEKRRKRKRREEKRREENILTQGGVANL